MANDNILEWVIVGFIVIIPWAHKFYETYLEHKEKVLKEQPEDKKVGLSEWK